MNNDRYYYPAFSSFKGIGPVALQKLIGHFGTVKNAWEGEGADLEKILGKAILERFLEFRKTFSINRYIEELEKKNIQFITIEDKEYPVLLKKVGCQDMSFRAKRSEVEESNSRNNTGEIDPSTPLRSVGMTSQIDPEQLSNGLIPPFILYCKGDVSLLNYSRAIAIVGTRKITNYGKDVTEMLAEELVGAGFLIVSGLAYGVDACAHTTAIECGGKTIAVLGSGVDRCFPPANQHIYDRILSAGSLIVSQFLPGSYPITGSFPARNKIISGLSLGTIVTEGAQDSGSLITADYSFKYNRPVFAVPGPITSGLSKGPNSLLQKGAIAVARGNDIVVKLFPAASPWKNDMSSRAKGRIFDPSRGIPLKSKKISRYARNDNASKVEQQIFSLLEPGPLHFDEIVRKIGKSAKDVGSILSLMEIKGMVKSEGGIYSLLNCYIVIPSPFRRGLG